MGAEPDLTADSYTVQPLKPPVYMRAVVPGLDYERVLFVGHGQSAIAWYRCFLPAIFLGCDWIGLAGEPPKLVFLTGQVKGQTRMADFRDYDTIVLQQPRGTKWLRLIRELQRAGKRIIYEVDDYVHGIRKLPRHDYADMFTKDGLAQMELCMRACDGIVTSTEFIAKRYRAFNKRLYVCENGIDMTRYALTRPPRATVNIGWAGGTGHEQSVGEWLIAVGRVMSRHQDVMFVSIGQDFAASLRPYFPDRTLSVPFTLVDCYPAAMTMFDIAIAPAGRDNFFRGKSDLRWLEAGALGIPTVADPDIYHHIDHGTTGLHARSASEAEEQLELLVDDAELRTAIGTAAWGEVKTSRDMPVAVGAWAELLLEVSITSCDASRS